jgi:hypothetical protein
MRLPLGILSGIGFIGAGVIVKRGVDISGVTTAACLWIVTVLGLLFGGGNIYLSRHCRIRDRPHRLVGITIRRRNVLARVSRLFTAFVF